MLVRAGAKQWGVPESECETDLHTVVHKATGRKIEYGQLVSAASQLPVPSKDELKFKPKTSWRYVGKGSPSYDLADICDGKQGSEWMLALTACCTRRSSIHQCWAAR